MDINKYSRGSVWWYTDDVDKYAADKGLIRGTRPVIILSSTPISNYKYLCTFVPCTTSEGVHRSESYLKRFYRIPLQISPDKQSYAVCSQIFTDASNKLSGYVGLLSKSKLTEVTEEVIRYLQVADDSNVVEECIDEKCSGPVKSPIVIESIPAVESTKTSYMQLKLGNVDQMIAEAKDIATKLGWNAKNVVICTSEGKVFRTQLEASKYYGIHSTTIRNYINNSCKSKGGLQKFNLNFAELPA